MQSWYCALLFIWTILVSSTEVDAGCGGYRDLPLQMGKTNSINITGSRDYPETDIQTLKKKIQVDIKGLSPEYAMEIAENALGSDEDFEHTFMFCMHTNRATLTQYEITTKKKAKKLTITWRIAEAELKFTALREFTVHARRRRKIWSGRRRCSTQHRPRGVTKIEIAKIRNTLTSAVAPSVTRGLKGKGMRRRKYLGSCKARFLLLDAFYNHKKYLKKLIMQILRKRSKPGVCYDKPRNKGNSLNMCK